jgi:hypothetical protein
LIYKNVKKTRISILFDYFIVTSYCIILLFCIDIPLIVALIFDVKIVNINILNIRELFVLFSDSFLQHHEYNFAGISLEIDLTLIRVGGFFF